MTERWGISDSGNWRPKFKRDIITGTVGEVGDAVRSCCMLIYLHSCAFLKPLTLKGFSGDSCGVIMLLEMLIKNTV